jgi:hypothetical protein
MTMQPGVGCPARPEQIVLTANLIAGWLGMLGGAISGAVVGLFFHRDEWMGGYQSYRRRLTRLGHIAFFGLGFLNLIFAATSPQLSMDGRWLEIASRALIVGAIAMPVCCFLTAWHKPLRHLFPVPVLAVATGIVAVLIGGWNR